MKEKGFCPHVVKCSVLSLALSSFLVSCGGGGAPPPNEIPRPTIVTGTLPDTIIGEPYSQTLRATGGVPPYRWSWNLVSGSNPGGLELSPEGIISGATQRAVEGIFRIEVVDSNSQTTSKNLKLTSRSQLVIENEFLKDGSIGVFYVQQLAASGGLGFPLVWSITSGKLPEGISLTDDRLIGTPTEAGTFQITTRIESGLMTNPATKDFSLFIDNKPLITTENLPDGVINEPYNGTLTALGGIPPYTWSLTDSPLPMGLVLDANTGEISGIPTEERLNTALTVQVEDSSMPAQTATAFVWIQIRGPLAMSGDGPFPAAIQGTFYHDTISVSGGRPPYNLQVISGSLPDGHSLKPHSAQTFAIEGKATSPGTFPFTLELSDSSTPPALVKADRSITVIELLKMTTEQLPPGVVETPYTTLLEAKGGTPPYTWEISNFNLPGLIFDSATGEISGIPLEPVEGSLRIELRDSGNDPITQPSQFFFSSLSLIIKARMRISTSRLPPALSNAPYNAIMGVRGGTPPYIWNITSGSLPNGLTLDTGTGEISGIVQAPGTHEFTLELKDSDLNVPQTDTRTFSLVIKNTLGRNDSIATAMPLSNGTYQASMSPYADPLDTNNPDTDYYEIVADEGATVTIEILAEQLPVSSPLDSVIEILRGDGTRYTSCRDTTDDFSSSFLVRDTTPELYDDLCVNDDNILAGTLDSKIQFRVPGQTGNPVTFYVHVLDYRGDARPEFAYQIKITGAL